MVRLDNLKIVLTDVLEGVGICSRLLCVLGISILDFRDLVLLLIIFLMIILFSKEKLIWNSIGALYAARWS